MLPHLNCTEHFRSCSVDGKLSVPNTFRVDGHNGDHNAVLRLRRNDDGALVGKGVVWIRVFAPVFSALHRLFGVLAACHGVEKVRQLARGNQHFEAYRLDCVLDVYVTLLERRFDQGHGDSRARGERLNRLRDRLTKRRMRERVTRVSCAGIRVGRRVGEERVELWL